MLKAGKQTNEVALRTLLLLISWTVFLAWGQVAAQEIVPGEYIVKLKGQPLGPANQKFMGKMSGKVNFKASLGRLNLHAISLKSGDALEELRNDPDVEYIEPNYILHRFDDQPGVAQAFSMEELVDSRGGPEAMGMYSQNGAPVHVEEAWSTMTSTTFRPIVAVVDSGVDVNHSVFVDSSAIWRNPGEIPGNGIDDDGNGLVDDVVGWNFLHRNASVADPDGHGTHVAGIILGTSMDIFAGALSQSPIQIMPLKFLGTGGSGSTADAVSAIYYAVNNGARVINASWGGTAYSQALHDAMAFAYSRGVVLISAAGNYSANNDQTPIYPSSLPVPSMASVAASNNSDSLASFSNFGRTSVLVSSPGVGILSTYPGNQFRSMSGTSMASPFAAGLAALAVREAPLLTGFQIRNILASSVFTPTGLSGKVSTNGRTDALAIVQAAISQKNTAPYQPAYTPSAPNGARDPASASSSKQSGSGCGTIQDITSGGGGVGRAGPVVVLLMVPLLVWMILRVRALARPRRRHDRFVLKSDIKVMVDGRELVGQMQTISMGGLSFQADELLEKGGVLKVQISSPNGGEQIVAEGRIVWNENNKAYGVQFNESPSLMEKISMWTAGLTKA